MYFSSAWALCLLVYVRKTFCFNHPIVFPIHVHVPSKRQAINRDEFDEKQTVISAFPAAPPTLQKDWHVHYTLLRFGDSKKHAKVEIDSGSPDLVLAEGTSAVAVDGLFHDWSDVFPFSLSDFSSTYGYLPSSSAFNLSCETAHHCFSDPASGLSCGLLPGGVDLCLSLESYGDQSVRQGYVTRDVVHFGNFSTSVNFIVSARLPQGSYEHEDSNPLLDILNDGGDSDAGHNGFDGTLGLSPTSGDERPSFFSQLCATLPHCAFALCLPDIDPLQFFGAAQEGQLVLGAYDGLVEEERALEPPFAWVPLVEGTKFGDEKIITSRYLVNVMKVMVSGATLNVNQPFLVDSGSSTTTLPRSAFDFVRQTMVGMCNDASSPISSISGLCTVSGIERSSPLERLFGTKDFTGTLQRYSVQLTGEEMAKFPTLTFLLEMGVEILIDWKHLFRQDSGHPGYVSLDLYADETNAILGNNVIRRYQTVFDQQQKRIAFKYPRRCVPPPPTLPPTASPTTATSMLSPTYVLLSPSPSAFFLSPLVIAVAASGCFLVFAAICLVFWCIKREGNDSAGTEGLVNHPAVSPTEASFETI